MDVHRYPIPSQPFWAFWALETWPFDGWRFAAAHSSCCMVCRQRAWFQGPKIRFFSNPRSWCSSSPVFLLHIYFSLRYFAVHCFGSIFVTSKKIRHKMHFHISDYDSTWQPGNKKKLRPMTHREDHPKPLQKANYSFSPVWQPGWF